MTVSTKTLHIIGNSSDIEFSGPENLLSLTNANNISIDQSCDGNGTCTTCRVFIHKGLENCTPRTELEIERAIERNFQPQERLACQTTLLGSVQIEILGESEPRA